MPVFYLEMERFLGMHVCVCVCVCVCLGRGGGGGVFSLCSFLKKVLIPCFVEHPKCVRMRLEDTNQCHMGIVIVCVTFSGGGEGGGGVSERNGQYLFLPKYRLLRMPPLASVHV